MDMYITHLAPYTYRLCNGSLEYIQSPRLYGDTDGLSVLPV